MDKQMLKPTILTIDACTTCQLKCPRCPVTTMGYECRIGEGHLKFNDFKNLLDANHQIKAVELDNTGELFFNPEILPILEYLYKKGVHAYCTVGVNLNYATEAMLEGLVKYKLRSLSCSIDGATPETYSIYRVGGDFNKVIENIKLVNHFKKIYNSRLPYLKWQFIIFGHNEHEIPMAKKMAAELDMEFIGKMSWDSAYSPIRDRKLVMAETGWPAVTREEYENVTGKSYIRTTCYALWHTPRINWDGRVLGCCWNVWSDFGSNVFRDGYITGINSEKIAFARQMLLGRVGPMGDIPCATCEIYQSLRASGKYLTIKEIFPKGLWRFHLASCLYRIRGFKKIYDLIKKRDK